MNIADYICIGIVLISLIVGIFNGLIYGIYKVVTYIVAIILAFIFAKPLAEVLYGTSVYDSITDKVVEFITGLNIDFSSINTLDTSEIGEKLNGIQLPDTIMEGISSSLNSVNAAVNDSIQSLAISLTDFIVLCLCGIALLVVFKIVFSIIGHFIKSFTEIPIIKQIDKLGGAAAGAVIGYLILLTIGLVLALFVSNETIKPVFEIIDSSKIATVIYNNNFLLGFFN